MSERKNVVVNNEYKDRLFNFIFGRDENRIWTLSLYNAINGSDYKDPSLIEFNTIENILYLGMRNDTSFIISGEMNVYEQQSTFNPNMPLRLLEYVGKLFSGYISKNKFNKYGEKLIPLPYPKLVVFYNGLKGQEDESILRLSDSFDNAHRDDADIEVRVRMLNVNYGRNEKIMVACRPLYEYSWLIKEIRQYLKMCDILEAVDKAISSMTDDFLIKSFLVKHKEEVEGMLDTEYNEAEIRELFMEDGRAQERENTEKERQRADKAEGRIKELETLLAAKGYDSKYPRGLERSRDESMLDTEYNEAAIRELFIEDGRAQERENAEKERQRADKAEERAENAEKRIKELEALLAAKS